MLLLLQFIKGDLQSADLLSYVLNTEQIDTVMHFAAQTHVDNSFGNSLAFTMNNTCVSAERCWVGRSSQKWGEDRWCLDQYAPLAMRFHLAQGLIWRSLPCPSTL